MTREEAIERLKNIKSVPSMFIDETIEDLVEAFQQPPTLAEMLGWQEGQEYEWRGGIFRINSDILQVWDKEDERWYDSIVELNDYLRLRQAKKVEPKPIAWQVRDEYSYNCLIEEFEEQGYTKGPNSIGYNSVFPIVYINLDGEYSEAQLGSHRAEMSNIIDYYREEPRYLLQTDLTSENGIQYLSFDKNRRKYFLGALMVNENVQQSFTDDEITKINLITRFAKLCKKIQVG